MNRRQLLLQSLAAALAAQTTRSTWDSGSVVHLLPTASDRRILLKASFSAPLAQPPSLRVGTKFFPGGRTDSAGRYWSFDAPGLDPARPHELQLVDAGRRPLCAPWNLRTLPDPQDRPSQFRLLIYTCAGGHDVLVDDSGEKHFLSLAIRRRLLERALSFGPDAVVANGDHVYWDLRTRTARKLGASAAGAGHAGTFDRGLPVIGTANEDVLERAAAPQIVPLYGTRFREVPVFFVTDDHDYFENDEADDRFVSFPPDHFMLRLARATRRRYYPEFLPDANRPVGLPGSSAADRSAGVSECFGTLRYGRLAEILTYDCRRYLSLTGPSAGFIPPEAEEWLRSRMADPAAAHVVNVPSTPPGWSAGKWGEWYPDILDEKGVLGTVKPKLYWQPGWGAQHDRILRAVSGMRNRVPLIVSGDLHAVAEGRIQRTGSLNLKPNPPIVILPGPVSTGREGWPSSVRMTPPLPPRGIDIDQALKPTEENGFLILDFTPDKIVARFFKWNVAQPEDAIDRLEPFRVTEMPRPG